MTSPCLFVACHPDDETLAMSVPIVEHLAAGLDVHVLLLTVDGTSAVLDRLNGVGVSGWWGVAHDGAREGYPTPMSQTDFAQARLDEFTAAVGALSSGLGDVSVHYGDLTTNAVTSALVQAAITTVADLIAPGAPVRIKTHSPVVDDHPDHLAAGAAALALKAADPIRFGDLRHYILPAYWSDARLSSVTESSDTPSATGTQTAAQVRARVVNAIRAYSAWAPPRAFAIGRQSVLSMFNTLETTPKSLYHT